MEKIVKDPKYAKFLALSTFLLTPSQRWESIELTQYRLDCKTAWHLGASQLAVVLEHVARIQEAKEDIPSFGASKSAIRKCLSQIKLQPQAIQPLSRQNCTSACWEYACGTRSSLRERALPRLWIYLIFYLKSSLYINILNHKPSLLYVGKKKFLKERGIYLRSNEHHKQQICIK